MTATFVDIETLARTLWGEARSEGKLGMEAVAEVIRNRVADKRWPNRYTLVCHQPMQFSCWNTFDPNLTKVFNVDLGDPQFRMAYAIAARTIAGDLEDRTCGSNHYMTSALFERRDRPSWADPEAVTCRVGRHVFMKL